MPGLNNLGKKTKNTTPKKTTPKKQFTKEEVKIIKTAITTFIRTYRGNLKQWVKKGNDVRDAKNYPEIIDSMMLYKKLHGHYYYNKELYDLLKIKKGEDLENVK